MLRYKLKLPPIATETNDEPLNNNETNEHSISSVSSVSNISNHFGATEPNLSKFFKSDLKVDREILELENDLSTELSKIEFLQPIAYIYNPLIYAHKPHKVFIKKYLKNRKPILFLGLNPGPKGMCQTGIPFGNTNTCIEWFDIQETVDKPQKECPERPIIGFDYKAQEISGKRFWTVFRDLCDTPENFFRYAFIYNYCPLAFMASGGKNLTPSEFKGANRNAKKLLEGACDRALFRVIQLLEVKKVVAIGVYAQNRANVCLKDANPLGTQVVYLPHPSPLSRKSQKWVEEAEGHLDKIGVLNYFRK